MDKNQVTGLVLISALLMAYAFFFAPSTDEAKDNATPAAIEQTATTSTNTEVAAPTVLPDSLQEVINQQTYGSLASAAKGEEATATLENKFLKVVFSTKGASIKTVELKEYKTYQDKPLILVDEASSKMQKTITYNGKAVDLNQLYFSDIEQSGNKVNITLNVDGGQIVQTYELPADAYTLNSNIAFNGLSAAMDNKQIAFDWTEHMKRVEPDLESRAGARMNTSAHYYTVSKDFEELSMTAKEKEAATPKEAVKWVAFKQKFFTSSVIPSKPVTVGEVSVAPAPVGDTTIVKTAHTNFTYNTTDTQLTFFFGPNQYHVLKDVTEGFDQNLNLGWFVFKWVNKYLIIPIFHFFEGFFSNYGIIILLLVIVIKMLLFPLTYKSYLSMAKMRILQPEINEIKEQNPDDTQAQQTAQMALYSKAGVNPLSGCIPMFLQMPILFAMFRFFPNSVELRQQSFLWAHDLSTFDSIYNLPFHIPFYGDHISLFTLLMTVSTILYTKATNQNNAAMAGPMKNIQYFMPIMMIFFLNDFPAGLTYYYFLSNIITFGQTYAIRKFVDDDAIHAKMQEAKKTNKDKKGGFQSRIQEAMKQSQEMQKQKKNKK
ncbi:membrane protein insertase YidC [Persicobacter psychrovividus]|uniref:Membrane protein insertase YidC n=1 Tax=Persicobacter psychrovividus TaxID=387638 RepID=A0ABN6LCD3_9BACT|nr:membrane protein insertase YidC [Persicobacter psychrovividus]